jgi:hypothetical protein
MRKTVLVSLIALMLSVGCVAYAQSKSDSNPAGTWSGTWTGGSTGKFEMTIAKGADGKLSATMTANSDQGETSNWQSKLVEADGDKLTIKFDDSDGESEGTLHAVIEGSSMKGDYSVSAKATGEQTDNGTFTATRK